ncbi:DnaJ C terminal region domain-containing protein [Cardiosporidium cionae]|uniref:DnaJ C terminal region domain-containing protein n=1 Tax=Cardiosporidium cionae TaxID=476202 RepID=A0ABQ7J8W3_9APIC|nr:DnaJ C terminal region domain-containing protein [Cardiosporidium cionae]|eukprot:KAF8820446.1 DnaJ C terminal region domain-containing protein [Cardiosporidium cionae]
MWPRQIRPLAKSPFQKHAVSSLVINNRYLGPPLYYGHCLRASSNEGSTKNYYEVLGLHSDASLQDIDEQYKRLTVQWHPDLGGDKSVMQELDEAYDVLSNIPARRLYDKELGETSSSPIDEGDLDDPGDNKVHPMVENVFSSLSNPFDSMKSILSVCREGQDAIAELPVNFQTAAFGGTETVHYESLQNCQNCHGVGSDFGVPPKNCQACKGKGMRTQNQRTMLGYMSTTSSCTVCNGMGKVIEKKCPTCEATGTVLRHDSIKVEIPVGSEEGTRISLKGKGHCGKKGGQPGNLNIILKIKPHPNFTRVGADIRSQIDVSYTDAILGTKISVDVIDGSAELTIPPGTQPDASLRLRGRGVPFSSHSSKRGDHYVTVKVRIPRQVDSEERALLEKLKIIRTASEKGQNSK